MRWIGRGVCTVLALAVPAGIGALHWRTSSASVASALVAVLLLARTWGPARWAATLAWGPIVVALGLGFASMFTSSAHPTDVFDPRALGHVEVMGALAPSFALASVAALVASLDPRSTAPLARARFAAVTVVCAAGAGASYPIAVATWRGPWGVTSTEAEELARYARMQGALLVAVLLALVVVVLVVARLRAPRRARLDALVVPCASAWLAAMPLLWSHVVLPHSGLRAPYARVDGFRSARWEDAVYRKFVTQARVTDARGVTRLVTSDEVSDDDPHDDFRPPVFAFDERVSTTALRAALAEPARGGTRTAWLVGSRPAPAPPLSVWLLFPAAALADPSWGVRSVQLSPPRCARQPGTPVVRVGRSPATALVWADGARWPVRAPQRHDVDVVPPTTAPDAYESTLHRRDLPTWSRGCQQFKFGGRELPQPVITLADDATPAALYATVEALDARGIPFELVASDIPPTPWAGPPPDFVAWLRSVPDEPTPRSRPW